MYIYSHHAVALQDTSLCLLVQTELSSKDDTVATVRYTSSMEHVRLEYDHAVCQAPNGHLPPMGGPVRDLKMRVRRFQSDRDRPGAPVAGCIRSDVPMPYTSCSVPKHPYIHDVCAIGICVHSPVNVCPNWKAHSRTNQCSQRLQELPAGTPFQECMFDVHVVTLEFVVVGNVGCCCGVLRDGRDTFRNGGISKQDGCWVHTVARCFVGLVGFSSFPTAVSA